MPWPPGLGSSLECMAVAVEITQEQPFIIYGAGILGRIFLENLRAQGLQVEYFLDRRADVLSDIDGIPVVSLEGGAFSQEQRHWIVVLAVSDYFLHETLALELFRAGFQNIVYKKDVIGNECRYSVNNLYDRLFNGESIQGNVLVTPKPKLPQARLEDRAFVNEQNGMVIARLPMTLLYRSPSLTWTYSPERLAFGKDSTQMLEGWTQEDHPFFLSNIQCELFQALRRGTAFDSEALSCHNLELRRHFYGVDETFARQLVGQYLKHFQKMSLALSLDADFFLRHPLSVKWHENGYFFILDGNTRAAFLFAMGIGYVPCAMPVEDYHAWLNAGQLGAVIQYLNEYNVSSLSTPVPHPYLYDFSDGTEGISGSSLEIILNYLGAQHLKFSGLSAVDLCAGAGFIAQGLARAGMQVTALETDICLASLMPLMNRLLHCERNVRSVQGDWQACEIEPHDIVVRVVNDGSSTSLGKRLFATLGRLARRYLFCELDACDDIEEFLVCSDFERYAVLKETFKFDRHQRLVVFSRE